MMRLLDQTISSISAWLFPDHLARRLRDYVTASKNLLIQRHVIFLTVTILGVVYFNPVVVIVCYMAILATDVFDLFLNRQMDRWTDHSRRKARLFLLWVMINTVLSATAIGVFVILIAKQQTTGGHFTPLFFLFAASLFAAMNNHQLIPAVAARLAVYGISFLYIALMDVLPVPPPLTDQVWLQFFTTVFVLYFILDCSVVFFRLYRKGLKQLEDIRVEHEKAMHAYEVKSKFLSTVSHELRTPLTSIKAALDLVNAGMMGPVPATVAPILNIAGKNSKRLADLINDLLDVQKIEAGEMVYNFNTIDVCALVQDSIEANKSFADQCGIGINCDLAAPSLYIDGDEARLMQVMANLLSNAIKFSPKGHAVSVAVTENGGKVRISVRDFGIGIDMKARDLVFGKFTQVDSSDQRQVGGTGLGMHISKQIVERHEGRIDFVSELGKGTTFFVEFDRCQPAPGPLRNGAVLSQAARMGARMGRDAVPLAH